MRTKTLKTFTIDKIVYDTFREISNKLSINKSKFVENKMKEFIDLNEVKQK